jgi:RNase H-fold protein (predicted Holliday junction resolvase)
MARELLNQSGLSGKKRKAQLDKLAAQILLSFFLESGPSTGISSIDG